MQFGDKVVLITGGGTGIGAAAAQRIAAEGGKVVVTGRRPEPIEAVAQAIGGLAVAGDATDPAHLGKAIAAAVQTFGGLDAVVANATYLQKAGRHPVASILKLRCTLPALRYQNCADAGEGQLCWSPRLLRSAGHRICPAI